MDCSGCDYFREKYTEPQYNQLALKPLSPLVIHSFCLLSHLPVKQLSICPNRDGIAPSDFVTCESCGKVVPYEESTFKRYSPLLYKWFGECKQCSMKKNKPYLKKIRLVSSDYPTCMRCGRIIHRRESSFVRWSSEQNKYFGYCKACELSDLRKRKALLHKCTLNPQGICTVCGTIHPESSLMNIPFERGEERKE